MHLGCHWIAEVSPMVSVTLTDKDRVQQFLAALPQQLGLTAVHPPAIQQGEDGAVRGVVLLSESHASAHTDPRRGLVFVDLFSCAPFSQDEARRILLDTWPGELVVDRFLERGAS